MTSLLWMLVWLPQALLAMSELPKPINDILNSSHFIHILTWEPGPGTPPGVHYNVTVSTETGASWVPVFGCEKVQHPLVCNLTEAFSDPTKVYLSRIRVLLDAQESQPVSQPEFKPITDTLLDLPLLNVTPCGQDLCVELHPPMERLRDIYDSLNYKFRIMSKNTDSVRIFQRHYLI
ncbi:interferon alpha/beta receptor 2-like [Pungitius pungitius]|uniref:interferon alpha/beta receptor 2-like n=1 Tax=Pungitius pungitius TaxID=134920 RepID=UPI002E13FF2C